MYIISTNLNFSNIEPVTVSAWPTVPSSPNEAKEV